MRTLKDHVANPVNDQIELVVLDKPGAGGACHRYRIELPDGTRTHINFQNGPIGAEGVNGVTQEVLLAIVIDRLASFQEGPFPSDDNAKALSHCRFALEALKQRTRERSVRGVEGTAVA